MKKLSQEEFIEIDIDKYNECKNIILSCFTSVNKKKFRMNI